MQVGVPANTMSSHLTILSHVGLVTSTRIGHHIVSGRPAMRSLLRELASLDIDWRALRFDMRATPGSADASG